VSIFEPTEFSFTDYSSVSEVRTSKVLEKKCTMIFAFIRSKLVNQLSEWLQNTLSC